MDTPLCFVVFFFSTQGGHFFELKINTRLGGLEDAMWTLGESVPRMTHWMTSVVPMGWLCRKSMGCPSWWFLSKAFPVHPGPTIHVWIFSWKFKVERWSLTLKETCCPIWTVVVMCTKKNGDACFTWLFDVACLSCCLWINGQMLDTAMDTPQWQVL